MSAPKPRLAQVIGLTLDGVAALFPSCLLAYAAALAAGLLVPGWHSALDWRVLHASAAVFALMTALSPMFRRTGLRGYVRGAAASAAASLAGRTRSDGLKAGLVAAAIVAAAVFGLNLTETIIAAYALTSLLFLWPDQRYGLGLAALLLALCPLAIHNGRGQLAEDLAMNAFYLLGIAVIVGARELWTRRGA